MNSFLQIYIFSEVFKGPVHITNEDDNEDYGWGGYECEVEEVKMGGKYSGRKIKNLLCLDN